MTRVLDFVRAGPGDKGLDPKAPPTDPPTATYLLYTLWREESVMLTRPLFELMLLRLEEGDVFAQELASGLRQAAGLPPKEGA